MEWTSQASEGTKRGRNNPISIKGIYDLKWKKFSKPDLKSPYCEFRYLLVRIGNENINGTVLHNKRNSGETPYVIIEKISDGGERWISRTY